MPENISAEALQYITEKAEALARHSRTLRDSVSEIADIFGDEGFCRSCGEHENRHYPFRNLDDTSQDQYVSEVPAEATPHVTREAAYKAMKKLGGTHFYKNDHESAGHKFQPKIQLNCGSVVADEDIDTDPFTDLKLKLCLYKNELGLAEFDNDNIMIGEQKSLHNASRKNLKIIVQQDLLQKFIAELTGHMETMTDEYGEVAELAKKMALACY